MFLNPPSIYLNTEHNTIERYAKNWIFHINNILLHNDIIVQSQCLDLQPRGVYNRVKCTLRNKDKINEIERV
jgi:hypothetical protein